MPAGTPVDRMYRALLRDGMDEGTAARIAQSKTGLALATGKPPKGKSQKAGAGALAYPTWTTQSQKAADEEPDMMELPSERLKKKWPTGGGRSSGGGSSGRSSAPKVPRAFGGLRALGGRRAPNPANRYLRIQQISQSRRMLSHIQNLQRQRGITFNSPRHRIAEALVNHANAGGTPSDLKDPTAQYYGFQNHGEAQQASAAPQNTELIGRLQAAVGDDDLGKIGKYNQNHDQRGRFSSGGGSGGGSVKPSKPAREHKIGDRVQMRSRPEMRGRVIPHIRGSQHENDPTKLHVKWDKAPREAPWATTGIVNRTSMDRLPESFASRARRAFGFGKFNPNHDERGRFASGSVGGTTLMTVARGRGKQPRSSLKSLRAAFHDTLKQRKTVDKRISTLRNRMSQFKRSSSSYKRAVTSMQALKLQRTELTRDLNRLGGAISRRMGPQYTQDWMASTLAGLPVYRQSSSRPSRKSADLDMFGVRRHFNV